MHTGEEETFTCGICSYECNNYRVFNKHLLTHTQEKPYKYCQCIKAFLPKENLESYLMIHTGEKPYKCN